MSGDLASLKSSISVYEKALQREADFIKSLRLPQNRINDPEISAAIMGPSASRLLDLYERLLDSYRKYVAKLEENQGL